MEFPRHISLTLEHNEHRADYATVEEYESRLSGGLDWLSVEEQQKAYAAQDFWTCQWYPDTPIGFCILSAHSLEALLAHIRGL